MPKLFFHKKLKKYYLYPTELLLNKCSCCDRLFEEGDSLIYHRKYRKSGMDRQFYCDKCFKHPKNAMIDEFLIVTIKNAVPKGSILITDERIAVQPGKLSSFDVADIKDSSVEVINRCRWSFDNDRNLQKLGPTSGTTSQRLPEAEEVRMILTAKPEPKPLIVQKS